MTKTENTNPVRTDPGRLQESPTRPEGGRFMRDFRLLINGSLVKGAESFDVINPATGRVLTAAPQADRAQLDQAVAAAKAAFPAWSAQPLWQRGALLIKLAEALEAEQDAFARLLTEEQGKPLPHALNEVAPLDRNDPLLRRTRPAARGAHGGCHAESGPAAQAARGRRGDHAVERSSDPPGD